MPCSAALTWEKVRWEIVGGSGRLGFDGSLGEERQVGQFDAGAGEKRLFVLCAQGGDRGDIDLEDTGQLRRGLQRLDHACGDGPADPRKFLDGAPGLSGHCRDGLLDLLGCCGGRQWVVAWSSVLEGSGVGVAGAGAGEGDGGVAAAGGFRGCRR